MIKGKSLKKVKADHQVIGSQDTLLDALNNLDNDDPTGIIFYFNAKIKDVIEVRQFISEPKKQLETIKPVIQHKQTLKKIDPFSENKAWISTGKISEQFIQNNYTSDEVEPWPLTTNIKCWNCTRNFETRPVGIPYKYVNKIFYTFGCFCSFSCAYSHNLATKNGYKWDSSALLLLLYKKMSGNTYIDHIKPAPPKEVLVDYGGNITEEEYQKIIDETSITIVDILLPPIVSMAIQCEKIDIADNNTAKILTSKDKLIVPLSSLRAQTLEKKLRISRKKPLGEGKTTILEKFLKKDQTLQDSNEGEEIGA